MLSLLQNHLAKRGLGMGWILSLDLSKLQPPAQPIPFTWTVAFPGRLCSLSTHLQSSTWLSFYSHLCWAWLSSLLPFLGGPTLAFGACTFHQRISLFCSIFQPLLPTTIFQNLSITHLLAINSLNKCLLSTYYAWHCFRHWGYRDEWEKVLDLWSSLYSGRCWINIYQIMIQKETFL